MYRRSILALAAMALLWVGDSALAAGFVKDSSLFGKIRPGVTTSKEVTELLGPPAKVAKFPRRNVEAWDYRTLHEFGKGYVHMSIEIDAGGIVRNVERIEEFGP